jgi:hypothetical protein
VVVDGLAQLNLPSYERTSSAGTSSMVNFIVASGDSGRLSGEGIGETR